MKLYKKVSWNHDGKKYEIRIMFENNMINIVTFLNNYPANGFRYQIILPKNTAIQNILRTENFTNFIENAKEDIKEDRWGNFLS